MPCSYDDVSCLFVQFVLRGALLVALNDALDALLAQFSLSARVFQQGAFCGSSEFPKVADGGSGIGPCADVGHQTGHIHLVLEGSLIIEREGGERFSAQEIAAQAIATDSTTDQHGIKVEAPGLVIYPRGFAHTLHTADPRKKSYTTDKEQEVVLVCADIVFDGGLSHPLVQALPEEIVVDGKAMPEALPILEALEFQTRDPTAVRLQSCTNRLLEILMVLSLRRLTAENAQTRSLLSALQDERIARVLKAIFETPGANWTVEKLAGLAFMSRSAFSEQFGKILDLSPAEFVRQYRMQVAAARLESGRTLTVIADELAYNDTAALSKAFKRHFGLSPQAYLSARSR